MITVVYWPKDGLSGDSNPEFYKGDITNQVIRFGDNEGPSFSIRLLVFNYEDCL